MQYGNRPLYHPKKIYAVGDIHNKGTKLESLLSQILPLLTPEDHLVFAGDLCDRGDDFPKVVELTTNLILNYPNQVYFVSGNHESMIMKWYLNNRPNWMKYILGTLEQTRQAYGLNDIEPSTIKAWLASNPNVYLNHLIPYYESPEVIVTHAGLSGSLCQMHGSKTKPEGLLDRLGDSLLWEFVDEDEVIPEITKFMICGHQYAHHKAPRLKKARCFIDTGCGRNEESPCTAIVFPGKKTWQSK